MLPIYIAFWSSLLALFYIYAGYPCLVWALSKVLPRAIRKQPAEPTVTLVIAAHNEERHLARTIEDKLALDYPKERLQVVVVSDGSTDRTDEIAARYASPRVAVLRQEPRNGKTAALNLALHRATGEIIVFADANSLYERQSLRQLVANFSDPTVGYVTGKLRYANPDGSMTGDGCGAYMRYENFLRTCETLIGSIVGVNGGIDAVRRTLFDPMDPDDLPDLVLPLRVVARGFRVVYDPTALLTESANASPADEYRMRVRVSLRALWALAQTPGLFDARRYGIFTLQLLSHKVLRYLAFAFLIANLLAASVLWREAWLYGVVLAGHGALALGAGLGYAAARRGRSSRLLFVPYYFVLVNVAAMEATLKFLRGERHRVWRPRLG